MSNQQVTVKLDSRLFYALLAIVAVAGIFAIGLWIGRQVNQPPTTAQGPAAVAPAAGAPAGGAAAPAAGASGLDVSSSGGGSVTVGGDQPVGQAPVAQTGARPVSVEDVEVAEGEPRIWIEEVAETDYTYDFGQIPADQATEKDFVVRNIGTGELVIEDASASCGCTAALVADSTLAPGEETTVRVSYDPRVNGEFGKFVTKQVRIKSNDPLVPLAEFTITADVAAQ